MFTARAEDDAESALSVARTRPSVEILDVGTRTRAPTRPSATSKSMGSLSDNHEPNPGAACRADISFKRDEGPARDS